jgi:hypothetical protein
MIHIGIDLGLRGALVGLDDTGRLVFAAVTPAVGPPSRPDDYDLPALLELVARWAPLVVSVTSEAPAVVRVPRRGGVIVAPTATQALSESWGVWRTALAAHGITRIETVAARTWQAETLRGLPAGTKAASCAYARARWADLDLRPGACRVDHDGLADAACIADWGRVRALSRTK